MGKRGGKMIETKDESGSKLGSDGPGTGNHTGRYRFWFGSGYGTG